MTPTEAKTPKTAIVTIISTNENPLWLLDLISVKVAFITVGFSKR